jgi:NADH:ubiquinone oxidoreductase subunit 6 (subunit J)
LQKLDRVYYMRSAIGVIAGLVAGLVIMPGFDQVTAVAIAVVIGIVFYIISLVVARATAKDLPKEMNKKVATDGLIPYMFMLIVFMIVMYTALHQGSITPLK